MFGALLWEEFYQHFVPRAFVSSFQDALLHLFTAEFFKNTFKGRNSIQGKLIDNWNKCLLS